MTLTFPFRGRLCGVVIQGGLPHVSEQYHRGITCFSPQVLGSTSVLTSFDAFSRQIYLPRRPFTVTPNTSAFFSAGALPILDEPLSCPHFLPLIVLPGYKKISSFKYFLPPLLLSLPLRHTSVSDSRIYILPHLNRCHLLEQLSMAECAGGRRRRVGTNKEDDDSHVPLPWFDEYATRLFLNRAGNREVLEAAIRRRLDQFDVHARINVPPTGPTRTLPRTDPAQLRHTAAPEASRRTIADYQPHRQLATLERPYSPGRRYDDIMVERQYAAPRLPTPQNIRLQPYDTNAYRREAVPPRRIYQAMPGVAEALTFPGPLNAQPTFVFPDEGDVNDDVPNNPANYPVFPPLSGRQTRTPRSQCPICLDRVTEQPLITLNCGHLIHHTCFNQQMQHALQSRATFPPRCCLPALAPINYEQLLHHYDNDTLGALTLRSTEFTTPNPIYCHNCGDFVPLPHQPDNPYTCQVCHTAICSRCGGNPDDHTTQDSCPDLLSPEDRALANASGFKHCPTCRTLIERIDGCNHMQCNQCRTNFCFQCGSVRTGRRGDCGCSQSPGRDREGRPGDRGYREFGDILGDVALMHQEVEVRPLGNPRGPFVATSITRRPYRPVSPEGTGAETMNTIEYVPDRFTFPRPPTREGNGEERMNSREFLAAAASERELELAEHIVERVRRD